MLYKASVLSHGMLVAYRFAEGHLARGTYVLDEGYTNRNRYLDTYASFKAALTAKYGRPITDEVAWTNDLYRYNAADHGLAVGMGHVLLDAKWQTEDTEIGLSLTGNNFDITRQVVYDSRWLQSLLRSASRAKTLDDL